MLLVPKLGKFQAIERGKFMQIGPDREAEGFQIRLRRQLKER